jgi:RimJ/RimL family protein N-acetyltransferase
MLPGSAVCVAQRVAVGLVQHIEGGRSNTITCIAGHWASQQFTLCRTQWNHDSCTSLSLMAHQHSIWTGNRIRLRAFELSDSRTYADWNVDTEQARALDFIHFPRSEQGDIDWAEREVRRERQGDDFRFTIEDQDGVVIGDLTVHHSDRRSGTFSYGISIAREYRRRGYASEAIRVMLRYYFDELRYQKVTAFIADFNAPSIRLHERLGFRREGQLRRMAYTRGQYHDQLVFGQLAEEFRAVHDDRSPSESNSTQA